MVSLSETYYFGLYFQGLAILFITIFSNRMSEYDFHRSGLRANNAFDELKSPKNAKKNKVTTEKSQSKQKQIITSFSKKQTFEKNSGKRQFLNGGLKKFEMRDVESPRQVKSQCRSQYYIKTAETKTELDAVQLKDQIKIKQNQLQILATRLAKAQFQNKQLIAQNQLKNDRIESLEKQLSSLLAKSLKQLQKQQIGADLIFQCQRYRQDQRRLLKMLEQTSEYEYFSKLAMLDDGVKFLIHPNQTKKTVVDAGAGKRPMHFCSCNKQYISQTTLWVPQKIYLFGKEFIKQRSGQFTKSQFELLLYELNRFWREREKKIINTLTNEKNREIQRHKRGFSSSSSLQKLSLNK